METDCTYIDYRSTGSFSQLVYDYIEGNEKLEEFYAFSPNRNGVNNAIIERQKFATDRTTLVNTLRSQYQNTQHCTAVKNNIDALLQHETFTICTAHQPNLMTGYLYFFYKILHAIKMAEELNEEHPSLHFVPVYYMGSEDNDLDELGQFWYEGQKYTWDADGQTGAVGRMNTSSLKTLLENLFKKLGPPGHFCDELIEKISIAYLRHNNISAATQYLVNELFGHYGLVVLNPDDALLKSLFAPIIEDELLQQNAYSIVQTQSGKLAKQYKAQAFPRPINLFYLIDGLRERIEKQDDKWIVLNSDITFSASEIKTEIKNHPERFSPNVILRGLFQETILPNICFIGGGSELAYWLQLKPLFEYYNVFFPVVYLRQSVQILATQSIQLLDKMNFSLSDIFKSEEALTKALILNVQGETWNLSKEQNAIEDILTTIEQIAIKIDPTLKQSAEASLTKMKKQVVVLQQKMYRAEKRKEKESIYKIELLKKNTHPQGGLQERIDNFMPYFLQYGFSIFDVIKNNIKAFDNQFLIVHPKP